ncbi:MAG: hypothetical protein WDN45_00175 [Caulobacteraceae bacterium]
MLIRFDECISWRIVEAIEQLRLPPNVVLETAQRRNENGQADIAWIEDFAQRGGNLIVSGDASMRSVQLERAALEASGLVAVFPSSKKYFDGLRKWAQAAYLIAWFPVIMRLATEAPAGAHYRLPATFSGEFESIIELRPLAEVEAEHQEKTRVKREREAQRGQG